MQNEFIFGDVKQFHPFQIIQRRKNNNFEFEKERNSNLNGLPHFFISTFLLQIFISIQFQRILEPIF